MSKSICIDLETTSIKSKGRISNPFEPGAEVNVYAEYRGEGEPLIIYDYEQDIRPFLDLNLDGVDWIIGHNIKFDMLFLWGLPQVQEFFYRGGRLWCTKLAEYFLRGHKAGNLDLDSLTKLYGGTVKVDTIKHLYHEGYTTKDIGRNHHDEMMEYSANDVINPYNIAKQQVEILQKAGRLEAAIIYMEHLAATCEYEYNGIKIDKELGLKRARDLQIKLQSTNEELQAHIRNRWPTELEFSASKDQQVSAVLFGGTVKYETEIPNPTPSGVTYYQSGKKKGELRTKKAKIDLDVSVYDIPTTLSTLNEKDYYKVDEYTLSRIKTKYDDADVSKFIDLVLQYREYQKVLGTYYLKYPEGAPKGKVQAGLLNDIYEDGMIHPQFKESVTVTGRLSSANPNAQNTNSKAQELIVSRWGDEGVIVDIDFCGQEVVTEAALSGCKRRLQDIEEGLDDHLMNASYMVDIPYEELKRRKEEGDQEVMKWRKTAKTVTFGKGYGQHEDNLAAKNELDPELVKKIYRGAEERYPEIYAHQNMIKQCIEDSMCPSKDLLPIQKSSKYKYKELPDGFYYKIDRSRADSKFNIRNNNYKCCYGYYTNEFGQRWEYMQLGALTNRDNGTSVFTYFSEPNIKNYYNQGFAAFCTKIATSRVFYDYAQYNRDTMCMISEIHDALLLDVKKSHLDLHIEKVCTIMRSVQYEINRRYGMNFYLPLDVEYSYGRSWLDAKESEE